MWTSKPRPCEKDQNWDPIQDLCESMTRGRLRKETLQNNHFEETSLNHQDKLVLLVIQGFCFSFIYLQTTQPKTKILFKYFGIQKMIYKWFLTKQSEYLFPTVLPYILLSYQEFTNLCDVHPQAYEAMFVAPSFFRFSCFVLNSQFQLIPIPNC